MTSSSVFDTVYKLRSLLSREEKLKWLGIVGFAMLSSLFEVITATVIVIFAQVLNEPILGSKYFVKIGIEDLSPSKIIFYLSLCVGLIYLLKNIIAGCEIFFQNFTIQKMAYGFRKKMLERYANIDYGFYLTRNSSFGLNVIGEIGTMFQGGMLPLSMIVSEIMVMLSLVSMIIFMNPILAFVVMAISFILGFIIHNVLSPRFYKWGQRMQIVNIELSQSLHQFFHGFKEIVLLGKERYFIESYNEASKKQARIQALQTSSANIPRIFLETVFICIFVVAIAFLCNEHDSPTKIVGVLGGYLYTAFRLMPGLNRIISQLNAFKAATPSINRSFDEYNLALAKGNYVACSEFQFEKNISFKNVSFSYLNCEKYAIDHLNLEIKKGEIIGIVGETGSGKSTIIDLLLGLLKPQSGEIKIDGKYPVNSYEWHQKIGYVPQSIYLIDDTIAKNIAFGFEDIDESRLNDVIDAAQLRKFVDQLQNGVQTFVGERGVRLSGGERQRIAIARALYKNPEVLVFDEATSALDNETESKLMDTIYQVGKNRTVIMIAHRLSTLERCDRIVRVDIGCVRDEERKIS